MGIFNLANINHNTTKFDHGNRGRKGFKPDTYQLVSISAHLRALCYLYTNQPTDLNCESMKWFQDN